MISILEKKYTKIYFNCLGFLCLSLIVLISILSYPSIASAVVDVTLEWDSSVGATGYRLFAREDGQSYNYNSPDWEGTTTRGTISGLADLTTYHFVVRAYNSAGESGDSNEETYIPATTPRISLSTTSLSNSCTEGSDAPSQTFEVWNSGINTLNYTISDNRSWLSVSPSSGTSDGEQDTITVSYNTSGLTRGNYNGTITISDPNADNDAQTISVSLTVNAQSSPPSISLSTNSLSNSCTEGRHASSQTFTVRNSGGGTLSYSISDDRNWWNGNWLSVSPNRGTSDGEQDTITVSYNTSELTRGNYNGTITISDPNADNDAQTISVSLTVTARPTSSRISLSTTSLSNSSTEGSDARSQTFQVWDSGDGALNYTISDNRNWLSVSPSSGSSTGEQDTISVNYNTSGLTVGRYTATITISDPNADNDAQTISVSLEVENHTQPPVKPVITTPYDGEMEVDLLLTVQTEPFSDPDGDSHTESRWQIIKQQDSSVVLDIISSEQLTKLKVPHAVFDRDTTYVVSVQFYGTYSEASEWSDPVEFTTTSDIVDFDGNGIPDDREVDDTVDLNQDSIPDNDQPDFIKSMQSAVGSNEPIGVSKLSSSIDAIEVLEPVNPAAILDKRNRPETFMFGLACYRLRVNQPGATALVRIYYSEDIPNADGYYLYSTVSGWQDYTHYTAFNPDDKSVTIELKDGGHGDSDGVANGIIVDPGGVTNASTLVSTVGPDSGATGGGCFIATAAFGSYVKPQVKLLREFRDQYLLTNRPGQCFVEKYYKYGPYGANYIERYDWLKSIVRALLMPLVGISYILVKTSLAAKILTVLLMILSMVVSWKVMHRSGRRPAASGPLSFRKRIFWHGFRSLN